MDLVGMSVEDLDTPCLLVDLDRMEFNIKTWQESINQGSAKLRPHVKTHKTLDIALRQLEAGSRGITLAKVSEAEVFVNKGFSDIFVAYPIIGPAKLHLIAELARVCRITVGFDSEIVLRGLSAAASAAGTTILVRVEVDAGLHRCGVRPEALGPLCRLAMSLPGLEFDGIYTFRSIYFHDAMGHTTDALAKEEGELMVALAERLRADGIPVREVSVGSTATARQAALVDGVTEVRPGTYVFGDYMNYGLGVMSYDELALSVLCTVVSRPLSDIATIDGGSKTFSGDIYPAKLNDALGGQTVFKGYAKAVGAEIYLEGMTEEHGTLRLPPETQLSVGDKVALYPMHVCTVVNLANELVGVRNGRVECVWPVLARGRTR